MARKNKLKFIPQMEHSECGLACLAMILNYFQHHIKLPELRDEFGSSSTGYSFYHLYSIAIKKKLQVKALKTEADQLYQFTSPVILHWQENHFVVLEKVKKDIFYILDPAIGRKKIKYNEFVENFSKNVLYLFPEKNFKKKDKSQNPFLLNTLNAHKKFIGLIILVTFLIQGAAMGIPVLTQWFTDEVLTPKNDKYIFVAGLGILSILLYYIIMSLSRGYLIAKLQSKLDLMIMSKFISTMFNLPYAFFINRSSGDLLFRANSNNLIKQLLSSTVVTVFIDILMIVSYSIIMFYYSIQLALVLLLIGILIIVFLAINSTIIKRLSDENVANQSEVQSILSDTIKGISDVKMLGLENKMFEEWKNKFKLQIVSSEKLSIVNSSLQSITSSIQMIVPLFMLWIGSLYLIQGDLTLGELLAFSTISVSFIQPIVSLSSSYSQIIMIKSYFQRITDIIESKEEKNGNRISDKPFTGNIEFRNVSFKHSYFSNLTLKNFNFSVKPKETVAIVGSSGSGKTTIVKLLLGFYSPNQGEILFDGVQIQEFQKSHLRKQIGTVMQESRLFNKSIFENISMFQKGVTVEEIYTACEKANILNDILALPLGFETKVSENGFNFSGGQIQRLLIARALVNKPPILIFDEASSSLDNMSEKIIHQHLTEIKATKFIIAHRLSTVKNADHIIVLDKGEIVEIGNHESLIEKKGYYYEMQSSMDSKKAEIFN